MKNKLPDDVEVYSKSPVFTQDTVSQKLTQAHNTKAGVWGRLTVMSGELDYIIVGPPKIRTRVKVGEQAVITPEEMHFVVLDGKASFQIEFLR